MQAIAYHRYGSPDVLQCEEVEKPVPKDTEVLIRVRAASLNPLDCGAFKGKPYTLRLLFGLLKPTASQVGVDVSGEVEAVGRNVTQFTAGDAVFGACLRYPEDKGVKVWTCQGAFAEYACAPEAALVMKPDNVTFEQAAAVPVAAWTALQGLRDKGHLQPGQKVLINGAAGGVGTMAVQIAKSFGAVVTGVCSTRNVEMVRSIGADRVFDYTREDFIKGGQPYDLILDCVGNRSLSDCRRALSPKGILVLVGAPGSRWFIGLLARPIKALLLSLFVSQKIVMVLAMPVKQDLILLRGLMEAGKLTPVVDRCYRLSEAPEAVRYLDEKHARGKVIVTLEQKNTGAQIAGRPDR